MATVDWCNLLKTARRSNRSTCTSLALSTLRPTGYHSSVKKQAVDKVHSVPQVGAGFLRISVLLGHLSQRLGSALWLMATAMNHDETPI